MTETVTPFKPKDPTAALRARRARARRKQKAAPTVTRVAASQSEIPSAINAPVTGKDERHSAVPGRSVAVRDAARAASVATGTVPPDDYLGRLITDRWEPPIGAVPAPAPAPAGTPVVRAWWLTAGRGLTGLLLAACGVAIAVTSIRANAAFGRSLTTDPTVAKAFGRVAISQHLRKIRIEVARFNA
jgi:hypothetical protein